MMKGMAFKGLEKFDEAVTCFENEEKAGKDD